MLGWLLHRQFVFILITSTLLSVTTFADDNICSRPVGFVRLEVGAGEQSLVSIPFEPFDASINGLLADQLSASSNAASADRILRWNAASGEYVRALKASDGTWVNDDDERAASEMTFLPGDGFFIENRQAHAQTVFLAGEVVLAPQQQVLLVAPLSLFGYPFSTAAKLNATALANLLSESVIILDPAATQDSDTLAPGRAYWFQGEQSVTWDESRPYEDLFPSNDLPPRIASLSYDGTKKEVALSITCTGAKKEELDILYQDVSHTQPFQSRTGWQVARLNVKVNDTACEWAETIADDCFGRYYLVLRADIDANGNGVPDGREIFLGQTSTTQLGGTATESTSSDPLALSETNGLPRDLLRGTNSVVHAPVVVSLRAGRVVYVDRNRGRDSLSGRSRIIVAEDGPKQTIRGGLREAKAGDTLVIKSGRYGEDLNISGKNLRVRIDGNVDLSGRRRLPSIVETKPKPIVNPMDITTNSLPQL